MIVTESIKIDGIDFVRTYSDADLFIMNEEGRLYASAVDIAGVTHEYTETDIPVEDASNKVKHKIESVIDEVVI